MATDAYIYPYPRGETATDSGDHLTWNLHGYEGQTPTVDATNGVTPIVYINNVAQSSGYTFNVGTSAVHCSITFIASQIGNTITCDYKWKYSPDTDEEFSIYVLEKAPNARAIRDVNGRNMIAESYSRTTAFSGTLGWAYITQTFWAEIRLLAENAHYTFDIASGLLSSPFARINNLYVTNYPKFERIAGCPGRYNVSVDVVQLA